MLTIFACPKAFKGRAAVIQRNAIRSWRLLDRDTEIILFGDDEGTAQVCMELGLRHIPVVARNEYGTPLLTELFQKAQEMASHSLLAYVNADMILMSDFAGAVRQVRPWPEPFLMIGARWGVEIGEAWDFAAPDWEERLRALVAAKGRYWYWAVDYFVFPRGLYREVPPFALGRGYFDGWLIWKARCVGAAIVDASAVVMAIHQDHDYFHLQGDEGNASDARGNRDPNALTRAPLDPTGGRLLWDSEEARRNYALAKLRRRWFLLEATHRLTPDGGKRVCVWVQKALFECRSIVRYRLGPLRHALGLRRASLVRMRRWIAP